MKTIEVAVINDITDYENALKRINQLFYVEQGTDEYYELKMLALEVENFETENFQLPELDPVDIIKFVLDQNDLSQSDLIGILGEKTNVSKILNRKRPLTLNMIRNFSERFKIPTDLLIKQYRIEF
jgi:HTH-type transcriptional regulator / antitoxin HigA